MCRTITIDLLSGKVAENGQINDEGLTSELLSVGKVADATRLSDLSSFGLQLATYLGTALL